MKRIILLYVVTPIVLTALLFVALVLTLPNSFIAQELQYAAWRKNVQENYWRDDCIKEAQNECAIIRGITDKDVLKTCIALEHDACMARNIQ